MWLHLLARRRAADLCRLPPSNECCHLVAASCCGRKVADRQRSSSRQALGGWLRPSQVLAAATCRAATKATGVSVSQCQPVSCQSVRSAAPSVSVTGDKNKHGGAGSQIYHNGCTTPTPGDQNTPSVRATVPSILRSCVAPAGVDRAVAVRPWKPAPSATLRPVTATIS